jgi:AraC family transcriptional regulator of adaptative response / DNA-3-methyladenine glycosylase II
VHDGGVTVSDLDFERYYRATESRDARFDGLFVVGVRTTGVYCRPSCPSPMCPKRRNIDFFRTAAAAQLAGLRACKRCRPDAVPGSPEWDVRADLVGRAMRLIGEGVVDREGVAGLARRLSVSERQVQRLLVEAVGAPPSALARARRAQTARLLAETTAMPFARVNETMRQVYAASPTELRAARRNGETHAPSQNGRLELRLPLRVPWEGQAVLGWLAARAVPGVEEVAGGSYRRTLRLAGGPAVVELEARDDHVRARLGLATVADLAAAVHGCRRLLDLDADPEASGAVLSADDRLAPLVRSSPGLRVPGSVDPAETAVRAVLGQQVSLAAARTLAARLVAACGCPLEQPDGSLTHVFPEPAALAEVDLAQVGLPQARQRTLRELAARLASGRLTLDGGADRATVARELLSIPGVGEWTASYVALRALGDPDAFPAGDLGLRRGARALGLGDTAAQLTARAERWRPWRSYAAHYLWAAGA